MSLTNVKPGIISAARQFAVPARLAVSGQQIGTGGRLRISSRARLCAGTALLLQLQDLTASAMDSLDNQLYAEYFGTETACRDVRAMAELMGFEVLTPVIYMDTDRWQYRVAVCCTEQQLTEIVYEALGEVAQ